MRMNRRQCVAAFGTGALSLALPGILRAQADQTLRILVGFAPGGAADSVARIVGDGLRSAGRTAVVDNKAGAGGRVAIDTLLNAPADGKTLLCTPSGNLTLFPHVYRKLRYTLNDLAPVASVSEFAFGLAVNSASPARSLKEFLARAKADPKDAAYGTPGAGTLMHFLGVMLSKRSDVPLTHIPYKGGAAALTDLLGGQVPAIITTVPHLLPMHRTGKVRIIAVSSPAPIAVLPDVPTFKAAGFPDLTAAEYFAFMARAGTPPAIVQQLSAAISAAVKSPEVSATLHKNDFDPRVITQDELAARLKAEHERWAQIVKDSAYTPED